MADIVISVENLGKRYRISHQDRSVRYKALRDVLADQGRSVLRAPGSLARRLWSLTKKQKAESGKLKGVEDFWALKDVSFEVKQGETLGIIGRNGAGKSTLLKILSRITEPTEGRVRIKGRVASLLEVGTGFHPELTGRENIFLNGAILGMSRLEIRQKFDEIVAFAEIEKFLDTPVKRYSSGMYVRLAFAVAAHLEPEILVIDEVLSVGDAEFQNRCLGKMQNVAMAGRTVLFISHQMATVRQLCERGLLLNDGCVVFDGESQAATNRYLMSVERKQTGTSLEGRTDREGNGRIRFAAVWATDFDGGVRGHFSSGDAVQIHIRYSNHSGKDLENVLFAVAVNAPLLGRVFMCQTNLVGAKITGRSGGGELVLSIARLPLMAGIYTGNLFCSLQGVHGEVLDLVREAFLIEVEEGDFFGTGEVPTGGVALVPHAWSHL